MAKKTPSFYTCSSEIRAQILEFRFRAGEIFSLPSTPRSSCAPVMCFKRTVHVKEDIYKYITGEEWVSLKNFSEKFISEKIIFDLLNTGKLW